MTAAIRFQPRGVDPTTGDVLGQYYIDIFDDFGNPVNGDGVVITYAAVLGTSPQPIQNISIPGISIRIFNGIVQYAGDGDYLNYSIISVGPSTGSPATVNPDLKIISVNVIKKADSAGLNGKVTIVATSSYGPISYYIDDVLQSGNTNLTVTAGPHTAKVIDSLGTIVTQPFSVSMLANILLSDPSKTVNGKLSRWNAAFNPIVFTYQRKDFDVTAIVQDTATLKPAISINTDVTGIAIGDYVYFDAGITNNQSTYKGAFKVLAKPNSATLIIDTDYIAPTTISGYANSDTLRPYYKINTVIKYVDVVTGQFKTIVSTNRPNLAGITRADISSFLQSILKPTPDVSDYTQVNYRDYGLAASYQISYAETWDGNSEVIYSNISYPYYVVYAAKQLQDQYGGNLFNYVTQSGGAPLAKWLTDFIEPSYTLNSPFDLGFIYSENIAGRNIYAKIIGLDINRQPLGGSTTVTTFLQNENSSYLLQQDGYKFIIARANLVNMPIVEHVGVNRLLINQDLGPTCCFLQVQLFYDNAGTPVPVTQPIIVREDRACTGGNPVYVRWIGLTGAWNYFRFNYNQTLSLDVSSPVIVKDYVFDWENSESIEQKISNDASDKVQLYADALDNNDRDGLKSLKFSPIVQILTSKNPIKWQTIIVNSSTFTEGETQNGQSEFSIVFNKASINIQQQ